MPDLTVSFKCDKIHDGEEYSRRTSQDVGYWTEANSLAVFYSSLNVASRMQKLCITWHENSSLPGTKTLHHCPTCSSSMTGYCEVKHYCQTTSLQHNGLIP